MTTREIAIAKKILDALHALDGGHAHALAVHAEIGGMATCSGQEFDEVLSALDARRWIIGVATEFKGRLWSLSDLGESARRKM